MAKLPKLKIRKYLGRQVEEKICDFEEGGDFLLDYLPNTYRTGVFVAFFVAVDGQLIHSYEELVQLANQDSYKHKEFLEVMVRPAFGGG